MHNPPLHVADWVGPVGGAVVFIVIMASVREPARRNLNAVVVAGAGGVYMSGGFGLWELLYAAVAVTVAYAGLRSYRAIGLAWLMHAGWDLLHHLYGNAIWPFMPTSSFGCMLLDSVIALWFLAGAPTALVHRPSAPTVPLA